MLNTNYLDCQPAPSTPVRDWPQLLTRISPEVAALIQAEVDATGLTKSLVVARRLKLAYDEHPDHLVIGTPKTTE